MPSLFPAAIPVASVAVVARHEASLDQDNDPVVDRHELTPAPSSSRRKPSSKRRREEPGERVTVYLPPDVATELRVLCARKRCSVSHATTEAIQRWLKAEHKR